MYIFSAYKKHTSKDSQSLRVKGQKRHSKPTERKTKHLQPILFSDKIHINTKTKTKNKEGHYIMIKRSTQQEVPKHRYMPKCPGTGYIRELLVGLKGDSVQQSNNMGF